MIHLASIENDILTYPEMSTVTDPDKVWLTTLVEGFTFRAQQVTGRLFERAERTMTFSPDPGDQSIRLPAFDNWDGGGVITSVHEATDHTFDSTTLIPSTDYYYNSRKGRLYRKSNVWTSGTDCVQVVWTDGFKRPPGDLKMACVLQTIFWFQSRARVGVEEVRLMQGGVAKSSVKFELLPEVEEVVSSYSIL